MIFLNKSVDHLDLGRLGSTRLKSTPPKVPSRVSRVESSRVDRSETTRHVSIRLNRTQHDSSRLATARHDSTRLIWTRLGGPRQTAPRRRRRLCGGRLDGNFIHGTISLAFLDTCLAMISFSGELVGLPPRQDLFSFGRGCF